MCSVEWYSICCKPKLTAPCMWYHSDIVKAPSLKNNVCDVSLPLQSIHVQRTSTIAVHPVGLLLLSERLSQYVMWLNAKDLLLFAWFCFSIYTVIDETLLLVDFILSSYSCLYFIFFSYRAHSIILFVLAILFGLFVCAIGCDQVSDDNLRYAIIFQSWL